MFVSEYNYVTLNGGEKVDIEHNRVVGTFDNKTDAESAAAHFNGAQGGGGFAYVAEAKIATSHAAVGEA